MSTLTIGPDNNEPGKKPLCVFLAMMIAGIVLLIGAFVSMMWPYL